MAHRNALTGYAPDARTGQAPAAPHAEKSLVLRPQDLPLRIEFNGRQYVLLMSRHGGMFLNAE